MRRWKRLYLGKPFLVYGENIDKIRCWFDDGCEIEEYIDMSYMEYINKIKDNGELIQDGKTNKQWIQVYKIPHTMGHMYVRFYLDVNDGIYYDFGEYQIWKSKGQYISPITWTIGYPKDICKIAFTPPFYYNVYSFRRYGQPKLDKPKELKGVKSVGSAEFIHKHCSPQIFIKNDDVWIKHTDYMSQSWKPPKGERIDMPMSYYLRKYFNRGIHEKFIYSDCWGDIVLRNEAWIQLKNIIPVIKYDWRTAHLIILDGQKKFGGSFSNSGSEIEWERFWENVVKVVAEFLKLFE